MHDRLVMNEKRKALNDAYGIGYVWYGMTWHGMALCALVEGEG